MYRPKKKKADNPTLPKDQQVDERNLVDAEESADISFEDRIHVYWMENKGFIIGCIIVLLLFVTGYQGMRVYMEHTREKLGEEYAEASANETLDEFARANSDTELGGFSALLTADEAYEEEDYGKALEYYNLAAEGLKTPLLRARSQIGQAFCLYHTGKEEESIARLNAIAGNSDLPEPARAEAAYHLAVKADTEGREDAFQKYREQIESFTLASAWQQRIQYYLQQTR
ncbi:MAG: tetratricopeptide repeat protein [Opitutales bacterium]